MTTTEKTFADFLRTVANEIMEITGEKNVRVAVSYNTEPLYIGVSLTAGDYIANSASGDWRAALAQIYRQAGPLSRKTRAEELRRTAAALLEKADALLDAAKAN